jgi:hypothetical protein
VRPGNVMTFFTELLSRNDLPGFCTAPFFVLFETVLSEPFLFFVILRERLSPAFVYLAAFFLRLFPSTLTLLFLVNLFFESLVESLSLTESVLIFEGLFLFNATLFLPGTIRLSCLDRVLIVLEIFLFSGRLLYFKLLVFTELFFLILAIFDLCGLYLNLSLVDLYLSILLRGLYGFLEAKAEPL